MHDMSSGSFMPHGFCFLWRPDVLWLHVISDALIALAYFCIPFGLAYFVRRRRDLPFPMVFWLFGAFIMLCGATHLLSIWVLWHPDYYIEGFVKAATAMASIGTAAMVARLMPEALKFPSPAQLREANTRLEEANARLEALYSEAQEQGRVTLGAVVDNVMDGVMTLDEHHHIESANAACAAMFGYEPREMVGQELRTLIEGIDVAGDSGAAAAREARAMHRNGVAFPVQVTVSAFTVRGGRYYVGVVRDITKIKQNEDNRQRLLNRLTESNTELERFAYVASHDMQEPLRMVVNFSQILTDDYGGRLEEDGREYLKIVGDSALRMRDMVQDLLDYARLGREGVRTSPVDMTLELAHVEENLGALIHDSAAAVTSDRLPMIKGNAVQLMRVMQNLVANGIKYQPHGRRPVIHVAVKDDGADWLFSVRDNGLGIDKAFIEEVFDPFRRLHTWEAIKGTGLGLAVCRKIVENHGGRIWAVSTPGQGSTFFFTLPKEPAMAGR